MASVIRKQKLNKKGIKWIKHPLSRWYRIRRALQYSKYATLCAYSKHHIDIIRASNMGKFDKAVEIAKTVINTQVAINKMEANRL